MIPEYNVVVSIKSRGLWVQLFELMVVEDELGALRSCNT